MVPNMNRPQRIPMSEQAKQVLADIGGEPLAGSGFEDEEPEVGFTESEKSLAESFRGWTVRAGRPIVL